MTAIPAKRYAVIDGIITAEIYLYIVFMFLTKGEAIRNILLFSAFLLWLSTIRYRKNANILAQPVSLSLWAFFASIIISSVFSIDRAYSFQSLKVDPLKSAIIFCLVSTALSDIKKLRIFVYLSFILLFFTISVGYYSYWAYDLPLMKPVTALRHAWHSRFAMDINTLLPFTLILLLIAKNSRFKLLLGLTIIAAIIALVLSTSRGGLAAFVCMVIAASVYLFKKYRLVNLKLLLAAILSLTAVAGILSYYSLPEQKKENFAGELMTLTRRTHIWRPLLSAASLKPFTGWGYGDRIFTMDEPFKNTSFRTAPVNQEADFRNPHNAFLKIFFHQGITGLIPYIALIALMVVSCWKGAQNSENFKSFFLAACASIMIGIYLVSSMVENPHLTDVTFIIGVGLAAQNAE